VQAWKPLPISAASLPVNARISDVFPACVLPSSQKNRNRQALLDFVYFGFYAGRFGAKERIAQTFPRPTADDIHRDEVKLCGLNVIMIMPNTSMCYLHKVKDVISWPD